VSEFEREWRYAQTYLEAELGAAPDWTQREHGPKRAQDGQTDERRAGRGALSGRRFGASWGKGMTD